MIRKNGFTLIELILYVALISIFMTGAVYFAWDVIYGREKAYENQIVEQSASIALARIGYAITKADEVQNITNTQLELVDEGVITTISMTGERLQISIGGSGPYFLNSNQVRIANSDIFTDLSGADTNSQNIKVRLICEQAQGSVPGQQPASAEIEAAYELKGQFNQARRLMVDLSGISFDGTDLSGITIQNTSVEDIVIDKFKATWSNSDDTQHITAVQFDGGVQEYTGSEVSGTTLELNDYTLTPSNPIPVDYITFDSDITGETLDMDIIMSDGSIARSIMVVESGVSNTPTPEITGTPTIVPTSTPGVSSCVSYCINLGYTSGVCLKNAGACSSSGYTYFGGGDLFCTGGANADTCCCLPL